MGYNTPDVYYNPEHFGLTEIGSIQWGAYCYDFDLTVVWQHEDGTLYWADDSGCSCPSPFEDFTSLESLETGGSFKVAKHITDRFTEYNESSWHSDQDKADTGAEVFSLLDKLMNL